MKLIDINWLNNLKPESHKVKGTIFMIGASNSQMTFLLKFEVWGNFNSSPDSKNVKRNGIAIWGKVSVWVKIHIEHTFPLPGSSQKCKQN